MANQDAPFGFRAVRMQGSGPSTNGQTQYLVANGYATSIFQGDPVEMVAGGTVEVANGVADVVVGVFNGVQYVDVNTRNQYGQTTTQLTLQATTVLSKLSYKTIRISYLKFKYLVQ